MDMNMDDIQGEWMLNVRMSNDVFEDVEFCI